ncbi:MAG: Hsp70 family protein, partial [Spirochaetales bacterium]|nr:Hsp70 family protein [Spirochaetales bacterium]
MPEIGIKLYDDSIYNIGDPSRPQGVEVTVTTIVDNQQVAEIEMYHIEKGDTKKPPFIGRITIKNIPPAKAGEPCFLLQIRRETDHSLTATARDADKNVITTLAIPKELWSPDHKTVIDDKTTRKQVIADEKDILVFSQDRIEKPEVKKEDKKKGSGGEKITEKKKNPFAFLVIGGVIIAALVVIAFLLPNFTGL